MPNFQPTLAAIGSSVYSLAQFLVPILTALTAINGKSLFVVNIIGSFKSDIHFWQRNLQTTC